MESTEKTDGLGRARKNIEEVDRELVRLIAERMKVVREIGEIKGDDDAASLCDPDREREVLATWTRDAEAQGVSGYFAGRILKEILNYSRRAQERYIDRQDGRERPRVTRVGYQGIGASYSDLTITKLFATRDVTQLERKGFDTFTAAIDALERGEIEYALLPAENTISGSIVEVTELLARRSLAVVDEEICAVDHCLAALPGADEGALRSIRSHPVALQQCQRILLEMKGCLSEVWPDTAAAAHSVADKGDATIGAICSEEAAERFGLRVLRRRIADQPKNLTRFLLIAKDHESCDARLRCKTSLVVTVRHEHGALASCLNAFARQDVNLTRIESRPQPEASWEYLFFIDAEGHVESEGLAAALEELRSHTNHIRLLGCYPLRTINDKHLDAPSPTVSKATPPPEKTKAVESVSAAPVSKPKPGGPPLCTLREDGSRSVVHVGNVAIGPGRFTLIAGPCAVESRQQIQEAAAFVKDSGGLILRGGAFKPRSSPYSFQGLGFEGLELLVEAGENYELPVVTEVLRPEDVVPIAARAHMLQVGARNMQNFSLLKELGRVDRPVLLKRGMSATVKELLQAAEYIMAGGNQRVVLCERGIRTFETSTRATLDLSAVPVLKKLTHLPVIVDPSHAAGIRDLVTPLAVAAAAVGADGLIVETHPNPEEALCDKDQALTPEDLRDLVQRLSPILEGLNRAR